MQAPHPIASQGPSPAWLRYVPYAVAAATLLFLLVRGEKFWMTNDDIRMSMTVDGYGGSVAPSSDLILESTVVWGWLVQHIPHMFGIRGYTLATYALLLASCGGIMIALHRARVPAALAAAAVLAMYVIAILYPQFTLLSGYLAVAGFAQVLVSERRSLRSDIPVAVCLLLLAGLIRPDELALVFVVMAPFLVRTWRRNPERVWRLSWVAAAYLCAAILGAAFLFNLHFSTSGAWQPFAAMEPFRGEFTDYKLGAYIAGHPAELAGTSLSLNDIRMISGWFYLDPAVFNADNFAPLMHSVSPWDRMAANMSQYRTILRVLRAPEFQVPFGIFLLSAILNWRRPLAETVSCVALLAVMLLLLVMGRAGILRIYLPVAAGMMVLSLLSAGWPREWSSDRPRQAALAVIGIAALAASLYLTHSLYERSRYTAFHSDKVRALTCAAVPEDRLVIVWAGDGAFHWRDVYRPTTPVDDPCDPSIYSIGSYQLAPPSLARLYTVTGGKNLVESLLAGQQFYIITNRGRLSLLDTYLQEHYHARLDRRLAANTRQYQAYIIGAEQIH